MKLLKTLREIFVELTWIKALIQNKVISSAMGRTIEWAIFTVYAWIVTFLIQGINSWIWTEWKATLIVLWAGFAKTILEAILKAIRDHKK